MIGLSAALHGTVLFLLLVALPLLKPRALPIVAYTVELTDSSSLGGRLAPGRADLPMGPRGGAPSAEAPAREGAPPKPEPIAKAEPKPEPEPPKPVETAKAPEPPKPVEPTVKLPSPEKPPPKPEPKKPEAQKPPEPKVEAKKPEPAKPAPSDAKKTETAKPAATPAKPADAKPSAEAKPAGKPGGKPEGTADGPTDAYAAAAEKWRAKGATGGGGGLGGTDTSPGPIGTPGYGGGGGGQVVGFEFLAYQQRVVTTVKGVWTNAAVRPGLVAKVRFQIAPNGDVSGVRLEQASGDTLFDGSVVRAVQRANPLPPPPARYVNEFREFMIEFHSEEGGQLPG
jgi:colicin import membrane protein